MNGSGVTILAPRAKRNNEEVSTATFCLDSQGLAELDAEFDRIEATFRAIASQYQLPHRRLLALDWASRYHGISPGTFKKAFAMWLESSTAEEENND